MDIVIFGISGNLAHTKLIPALEMIKMRGDLSKDTRLLGFSRSVKDIKTTFEYIHIAGAYDDEASYKELKEKLRPEASQLFYIALPPSAYMGVLTGLHEANIVNKDDPAGFRTILVEKPFGQGLEDAQSLLQLSNKYFRPDQCLKVDHYAGKEGLRNLEVPDSSTIKEVLFEIKETATVEGRSGFYDTVGALRDVGQNHLLFMLATFFKREGSREEVLEMLELKQGGALSIGSYEGYKAIETFFSVPIILNTEDARHISLTLRAGKAMDENKASIQISYASGKFNIIPLASGTIAYENIFLDALNGRCESFLSQREITASWRLIEQIEDIKKTVSMQSYPIGGSPEIV